MKHILLVGDWYSNNLGDGVIGDVVSFYLHKCINDSRIVLFDLGLRDSFNRISYEYKATRIRKELYLFARRKLKHVLLNSDYINIKPSDTSTFEHQLEETIKREKIDYIIFGGGQMFLDYFEARIKTVFNVAERMHLPIIINACGVADSPTKREKSLIKFVMESPCLDYISVRDGEQFFGELPQVQQTCDTAILAHNCFVAGDGNDVIGLGIMISRLESPLIQLKFWDEVIRELNDRNINYQLFCNGSPDDYSFMLYLKNRHGLKDCQIAHRPVFPNELVSIISSYKAIISTRLHSLIIAYSFNVPCVGIAWDNKVIQFYRKAMLQKYCFTFNDDAGDIIKAVHNAIHDSEYFYYKDNLERMAFNNLNQVCKKIAITD